MVVQSQYGSAICDILQLISSANEIPVVMITIKTYPMLLAGAALGIPDRAAPKAVKVNRKT